MIEIFKKMINQSTHPLSLAKEPFSGSKVNAKYVVSVILEFLRTLLENQIPQQPSQQTLLVKYILMTKDTQMMHCLLQYHVLADSMELARILINLGSQETKRVHDRVSPLDGEPSPSEPLILYYEPAYQLGLDMLKKLKSNEDVVYALLAEGLVMRALDYAVESNANSLKLSLFLQYIERLKTEGLRTKADFVLKRLTDLKRADDIRRANAQGDPAFKPMIIDE